MKTNMRQEKPRKSTEQSHGRGGEHFGASLCCLWRGDQIRRPKGEEELLGIGLAGLAAWRSRQRKTGTA
jgi:hypothetical protein